MPAVLQDDFATPKPANLAKNVVDEIAEQVAEKTGYELGADLERIVRELGGVIRYEDWGVADHGGSLEVRPGESPGFIIRLATFAGKVRNRFTIAHELGHYFLHSEVGQKKIRVARAGTGRLEWEANWFAGAFLLPKKRFESDWKRYGHSVARIAAVYQVSEPVVEIRLETLGLR